jgi:hypothetical protein
MYEISFSLSSSLTFVMFLMIIYASSAHILFVKFYNKTLLLLECLCPPPNSQVEVLTPLPPIVIVIGCGSFWGDWSWGWSSLEWDYCPYWKRYKGLLLLFAFCIKTDHWERKASANQEGDIWSHQTFDLGLGILKNWKMNVYCLSNLLSLCYSIKQDELWHFLKCCPKLHKFFLTLIICTLILHV